jgi:phosphatidylglycerophosphate synthase
VTLLWLTVLTASRLVLCPALWLWCWWKRPRGMVVWMLLAIGGFLYTDFNDGTWARAYGLVTPWGYWLDHVGDVLMAAAVFFTMYRGSREAAARRRKRTVTPPRPPAPQAPPRPPA